MKTTELLYYAINALPAPLWLAWIVAPRSRLARSFAQALWPWAILAALYVLLIGSAMFVFRGPPGADMLLYLALRSKLRGQGGAPQA